jgi:hypothetical protein
MSTHVAAALRLAPLVIPLVAGCFGDVTRSSGELGRLTYALSTDYQTEQDELTDAVLLTGHEHRIFVDLTDQGRKDAGDDAAAIVHRADGAEIWTEADADGPDLDILVQDPGVVTVVSELDGRTFDRIDLAFGDPTGLELSTWIRPPWVEDWEDVSGPGALTVEEGTQIGFVAIPVADGVRLAGDFEPRADADPPELAVPDAQVFVVQEGGVTETTGDVVFYAIEPGTVTFTLSDPVHGVSVARVVDVVPLGMP